MKKYFHSVTLDKEKCRGCTNCIKRCPTEAIRVRNGKAKIINERCIDCGECIRVCPYHAKKAVTDPFDTILQYKYKIALPAPTLYGQFKDVSDINVILTGLKEIGFDEVFEVAKAAEIVTMATKKLFKEGKVKRPAISSACPAVVRLICVRFPELIDNIITIKSPMEIAARLAKKQACQKFGLTNEEVGTFFITPCAAKVTDTKVPLGMVESYVDGVLSMQDVYIKLAPIIGKIEKVEELSSAGMQGINWAGIGGESAALGVQQNIGVDGIYNVIKVLEEIEDDKLNDVDFIELLACTGGCVGGPLTAENCFVAKNRVQRIASSNNKETQLIGETNSSDEEAKALKEEEYFDDEIEMLWEYTITHSPVMKLDNDMGKAMRMMEKIERINEALPGLDCGSCGAPSCYALAEDIIRGYATKTDCIFMLRDKVRILANQMMELESRMPPSFKKENNNKK